LLIKKLNCNISRLISYFIEEKGALSIELENLFSSLRDFLILFLLRCKNACIKNIDAWKAPMVISGILPSSEVNDTVGNIIHAGYKFYRSTNYNFITEETGKKVYVATNWSVEQTDPINVNIEEAVNIVQRGSIPLITIGAFHASIFLIHAFLRYSALERLLSKQVSANILTLLKSNTLNKSSL
jgi:hypothetical protein